SISTNERVLHYKSKIKVVKQHQGTEPMLKGDKNKARARQRKKSKLLRKQEIIEQRQRIMPMFKREKQDQSYIAVPKNAKPTLKESKNNINIIGAPKKKANV
ncbi:12282_t:CDS:2, partial [Gigaspora rosea]